MKKHILIAAALLATACGGNGNNIFPGTIETEPVTVSPRTGGLITSVSVSEGDRVEEGQLLFTLDQKPCSLSLEGAEAGLEIARANLETIVQGSRNQQLTAAAAAVQEARAVREQAEADFMRAERLAAAGALSRQELQAAGTAFTRADAGYVASVQSYSLAVEGARSSEIEAAEAAVQAAEASVATAVETLSWTSVEAPVSGTVTGIYARAGENAGAGMSVIQVSPMDTVKVVFYLPEPMLGHVQTGERLVVSSDGGFHGAGVVSYISGEAEFTPSTVETRDGRTSLVYRTEGSIPNPNGVLRAGMPVDVVLEETR